jgi:glycosyltransferase involved in cell wall biosynthesis
MRIAAVGNGGSVHVAGRSAAMAARGHEVRLVTVGDVLPATGVDVRTRPRPTSPAAALAAGRSFLRDIADFHPDLLHVHYAGGKLGALALLSAARPLVVTVMGGDVLEDQHPGGRSRLRRRTTQRLLDEAALVLVKSEALRGVVRGAGVPDDRIERVRWGVDVSVFRRDAAAGDALRRRLGLAPSDRVILSPRLLAPLYNVHLLVEAMPAILRSVPAALLLVTEYGAQHAYRERVAARSRELGVAERVRFVGQLEHSTMAAAYSMAEVVASVPSSDGLPQSLFEAMACGAPVVLGPLEGYREVVEDGVHAVFAHIDAHAIGTALGGLLVDDGRRRALARAARERVESVASLPREVERVEALYASALARRRPASRLLDRVVDALGPLFA